MMLLVISYMMSSYYYFGGWWNSSVGSLLIVFFSYLYYKKHFLGIIGLRIDIKTFGKAIVLAVLITCSAFLMMKYIGAKYNIVIHYSNWRNYYHDIFYILNEEIVLGAITLHLLVNKWKRKPIIASVLLALCFALVHFVFYCWIFNDRGFMGISTLITLFFIGIVRNNLILQTGHIAYSWALHFGWMAVMFGSWHVYAGTENYLGELIRFNTYLGSWQMMAGSVILVFTSLFLWNRDGYNCRLMRF
jgi:hypothetical protein